MNQERPNDSIDVFLQPGELYFGDRGTRIRTLLGSCVSLVFWHPHKHLGGMCHYMLPSRADRQFGDLDGRYADEAAALMFRDMREAGTRPHEYQVKVFGGANMFPDHRVDAADHVGQRNVEAAKHILKAHGLKCVCEHTAGVGHRNVIFDIWSGTVWVKHQAPLRLGSVAGTPVSAAATAAANAASTLACAA